MILNNRLIIKGNTPIIMEIKEQLVRLNNHDKNGALYIGNVAKNIKKLSFTELFDSYDKRLEIAFLYKGREIQDFISLFNQYDAQVIHMCFNEKKSVWIVNKPEYIKEYKLIPPFAINQIVYDYMSYIESSIVTDTYETIKFDRNSRALVINEAKINNDDLTSLFFEKTLKGKPMYEVLEEFVYNFHEKCINSYEELYSINKEQTRTSEEPSPIALIIVTFGILGIIFIMIYLMGYINF